MNPHIEITQKFGKRVRKLRLTKGLSQEDFALLCGLDRTYISSLERGYRNVSLKNITVIARTLEITLEELFKDIERDE